MNIETVNELIQRAEVPEAGESLPGAGCGECGAEGWRNLLRILA